MGKGNIRGLNNFFLKLIKELNTNIRRDNQLKWDRSSFLINKRTYKGY